MFFWGLRNAVHMNFQMEFSSNGGFALLNGLDTSRYDIWFKAVVEDDGLWADSPPKKKIIFY